MKKTNAFNFPLKQLIYRINVLFSFQKVTLLKHCWDGITSDNLMFRNCRGKFNLDLLFLSKRFNSYVKSLDVID